MLRTTSRLLALVLLCGVGQAGECVADDARFIGHLRQGTVELVGVAHYPPTNKSRWWQPDGPAAQLGPYRHQEGSHGVMKVKRGLKGLTFLVRFKNLPTDQRPAKYLPTEQRPARYLPTEQPSYEQDGYDHSAVDVWRPVFAFKPFGPSWQVDYIASVLPTIITKRINLFTPNHWGGSVVDADGNSVPDYYMFSAVVAPPAQTAVLRVGLSMDAWETVASQKPDRAGSSSFIRDGRQWFVRFYKAKARAGASSADRTQVNVKTTITWPESYGRLTQRLVAVTSDGSEQANKWGTGQWEDGRTIVYDLPLSSIKEFRFQVSPYDWVEFDNISLHPTRKTAVKVVSPDDPVNTEK